jgi:hypothetical protein
VPSAILVLWVHQEIYRLAQAVSSSTPGTRLPISTDMGTGAAAAASALGAAAAGAVGGVNAGAPGATTHSVAPRLSPLVTLGESLALLHHHSLPLRARGLDTRGLVAHATEPAVAAGAGAQAVAVGVMVAGGREWEGRIGDGVL